MSSNSWKAVSLAALAFWIPSAAVAQEATGVAVSDPAPALLPAVEAEAAPKVIDEDVDPELVVYQAGGVTLAVGGLVQLHLAPYVGDDALLADEDPAGRAGFRLRRARFGVDASLPHDLRLLLVLNPLESDPDSGTISDARISWTPRPWFQIWAGADKVPFSHAELVSSAELSSIERPLTARTLVPQRRLGVVVEGAVLGGVLRYAAGVMNATEGYEQGNRFSGLLYVARLEAAFQAGALRFGLGGGGFLEKGPATDVLAGSVDLHASIAGADLLVEAICDKTTPDDVPMTPPEVADEINRCGGYGELGYRLSNLPLQGLVRLEWLDDNTALDDAGDAWLLAAGVNVRPAPHLRAQLHYLGRYERKSAERANDAVVLSLQGDF